MSRVSRLRSTVATGKLLRVAALTAAGAIGAASRADAALYYWQSSEPGAYYQQFQPIQPPRRQKVRRSAPKKETVAAKEGGANPQAPLVIAVSIGRQQVKIYDANGFFAAAPVSTGMPGHPTPMGVFSVIQKHKFHHSNIYSGAPMPYMQRITWSGVAMHAGVLPGYPASHGCIRMPTAFAVKMWNWTKMGARVFVTPGEIAAPASFSHPLLPAFKVAPQPTAAELPSVETHAETKADRGAPETASAEPKLEFKSTVGQNDKPVTSDNSPPQREVTRTADAAMKTWATLSDAPANTAARRDEGASKPEAVQPTKSDAAQTETRQDQPTKPDQPVVAAKADGEDAKADVQPVAPVKAEEKPAAAKPGTANAEPPKPQEASARAAEAKPEPKPNATAKDKSRDDKTRAADDSAAKAPDAKKDQTRPNEPAVAKPELPKRTGQIAVFISRKDSKLYVRQNFSPLFQIPVTIAPSDRPFGTHVFTADVDKTDPNVLHWSVVSLPMSARAMRSDEGERVSSRRRKGAPPPQVEAKPLPMPDSPAEALDRITVPQDAMARVAEALTTGGSIIVSDQGINQGDTGEDTDFIVSLR